MQIIKYLQLPFYFDARQLQQEVEQLAVNAWKLHYQTLHYEGDWSAIPLRSTGGRSDSILISPTRDKDYQDTIFLNDCPYIQQVLSTFKCPLQAVRLLKLDAGAVIKKHTDAELCFEKGEVRFHVPVVTNDLVEFFIDKERLFLKEGECWYMNFNLPHNINNFSSVNRIHLVIDALVNDWVKDIFSRTDLLVKQMAEEKDAYDEAAKRQMIVRFREMKTKVGDELAEKLERELGVSR